MNPVSVQLAVVIRVADQRLSHAEIRQPVHGLRERARQRDQAEIARQQEPRQHERADQAERARHQPPADDPACARRGLHRQRDVLFVGRHVGEERPWGGDPKRPPPPRCRERHWWMALRLSTLRSPRCCMMSGGYTGFQLRSTSTSISTGWSARNASASFSSRSASVVTRYASSPEPRCHRDEIDARVVEIHPDIRSAAPPSPSSRWSAASGSGTRSC